jgi:hypothetical protein
MISRPAGRKRERAPARSAPKPGPSFRDHAFICALIVTPPTQSEHRHLRSPTKKLPQLPTWGWRRRGCHCTVNVRTNPANQHLDRRLDGIDRLEGMAGAALVIGDALLVRRQSRAFPFDFQIATSVEKDAIAKMATQSGRHGARGAGAATTEARHDRGTPCRGCSK